MDMLKCIGGPKDGCKLKEPLGGRIDGYRVDTIRTPQGDVRFMVPENQTALETLKLLLENYKI